MDRGKAPAHSSISGDGCSAVLPERCRVLLVDGDAISREIAKKILLECNNQVTTCSSGTEALAILRDHKGEFDVVMSDIGLPDMNGFEFVQYVDTELQLPVIVMIAEGNAGFTGMVPSDGVWGILAKPVTKGAVMNAWKHTADRKQKEINRSGKPSTSEQNPYLNPNPNNATQKRWKEGEELSEPGESSRAAAVAATAAATAGTKKRLIWDAALQNLFVKVVNQLGPEEAVPKKILEKMNVPELTRDQVASHLQKYRKQLKAESQNQKMPDTNSTAASGLRRRNVLSQNLPSISTNQNSVHSGVMNTQISHSSAQIANTSNISWPSRQPIFPNQAFYHPGNSNNLRFPQLEQPRREHPSQNPVLRLHGSAFNNSQNPQQAIFPRHNISGQLEEQVASLAYLDYCKRQQQRQQRQQRQQQMFLGSQQNHSQLYVHSARQSTGEFTANNPSALPTMANNITPNNTWNCVAGCDSTNLNTDRSMVVGDPRLLHANNNQYAAELPAGCYSLSSDMEGFVRTDSQIMADHFGETSNIASSLSRESMNDDFYNHPYSLSHADYAVYTNQEENRLVGSDFDTKDNNSDILIPGMLGAHNFEGIVNGVDSVMNEMETDWGQKQEKEGEEDP